MTKLTEKDLHMIEFIVDELEEINRAFLTRPDLTDEEKETTENQILICKLIKSKLTIELYHE